MVALSADPSMAKTISGTASWYGPGFHGKTTASGAIYNQNAMTLAHKSLPFGTKLLLTNTKNGRTVCAKVNDRGPYHGGRTFDVSKAVATKLGFVGAGTAKLSAVVNGC
jgi:rare lipoprotein A